MSHLERFGWITSVSSVGAATLSYVQYDKAYDNGRTHKNIPMKHLTPIVFGADYHQPRAERVVEVYASTSSVLHNLVTIVGTRTKHATTHHAIIAPKNHKLLGHIQLEGGRISRSFVIDLNAS